MMEAPSLLSSWRGSLVRQRAAEAAVAVAAEDAHVVVGVGAALTERQDVVAGERVARATLAQAEDAVGSLAHLAADECRPCPVVAAGSGAAAARGALLILNALVLRTTRAAMNEARAGEHDAGASRSEGQTLLL